MRKLIITCGCGQRMQVPRSAIGKAGMCPSCGKTVPITTDNAKPFNSASSKGLLTNAQRWWRGNGEPPEEAKRLFGRAVDLFYARHYGEALAVFNSLDRQYPGNPDIESGRVQCLKALQQPQGLAIEYKGNGDGAFDPETVRKVVLSKMLHGGTEAVQLQAAELAARILGMMGNGQPAKVEAQAAPPNAQDTPSLSNESDEPAQPAPPQTDTGLSEAAPSPIQDESAMEGEECYESGRNP